MKRSELADDVTWRTAVVPVTLDHAQYRIAHQTCHTAALAWNWLVDHVRHHWFTLHEDPTQKQMRAMLKQAPSSVTRGLHAHVKQCMIDDLEEAVKTYRANRKNGDKDERAPYRHHNYRPLEFTKGYGWRLNEDGTIISLSRGRRQTNLTIPTPQVTDPKTGRDIPPREWGSMKLCWERNRRRWTLNIAVPTGKPRQYETGRTLTMDEGIINPVAATVETETSYEILIINGREARAAKHYTNTRVNQLQAMMSRCMEGSRRWRKLDAKLRKAYAVAQGRVDNITHQTSRKTADFAQRHQASRIVAGDVRGIEQRTRTSERKRRRNPKTQRRRLSQWNRGKTEDLIEHKTGLKVEHVNESYSSQTCPACLTRNRPNGREYRCRNCGFTCHRDAVGSLNIHQKAEYGYYKPIDTDKPIHVTYLRATPLTTRRKGTLSNAPEPGLKGSGTLHQSSRSKKPTNTHTPQGRSRGCFNAGSMRAHRNGIPSTTGYAHATSKAPVHRDGSSTPGSHRP